MNKIKTCIASIALMTMMALVANAQQSLNYTDNDYEAKPIWIKMMDDPNANFYETIKAFRLYWKDRVLPEEPFENKEMDTFEKEVGLLGESKSEEEEEREKEMRKAFGNEPSYAAEVRAFKGWYQGVKPWVLEDGSIVSPAEQQKIIDAQRSELKQIENRNGKN